MPRQYMRLIYRPRGKPAANGLGQRRQASLAYPRLGDISHWTYQPRPGPQSGYMLWRKAGVCGPGSQPIAGSLRSTRLKRERI